MHDTVADIRKQRINVKKEKDITRNARIGTSAVIGGVTGTIGAIHGQKNHKQEEEEKTAGLASTIGRTLGGAAIGTGIGLELANKKNNEDPNATDGDKVGNGALGVAGGAVLGGVAGGVGGSYLAKGIKAVKGLGSKLFGAAAKVASASEELDELVKKAAMNVPTEEEKKKESNVVNSDDDDTMVDAGDNDTKKE